ncbi:hypothetical protein [Peterkaempfera sp. SMS 1(5)a]|uniref:hypothetical protein n=1 Tax=Peterkaempfera podocarpi TaxID=3232308 RepID=UPI003673059E
MVRTLLRKPASRTALPPIAVLLVLLAGAAAYANRPVPFGDRVAVPGVSDARPVSSETLAADGLELRIGPGLEAYDSRTGAHRWSYRREGAVALGLVRSGGDAVVVWDDGLVTAVRPGDHRVRWHRAVPGLDSWLRHGGSAADTAEPSAAVGTGAPAATGRQRGLATAQERARAVLHPVDGPEPWLAVLTPSLAMAFRERDGDIRWIIRPPADCFYDPARAARTDADLVVVRPCADGDGTGTARAGRAEGFGIDGRHWWLRVGPQARPARLDGQRITLADGPVLGVRVIDAGHGAPVPGCRSPWAALAAQLPAGHCPAPAGKSAGGRSGGR